MLILQSLPACRALPSNRGNTALFNDLLSLNSAVFSANFETKWTRPLLDAVLHNETDEVIWNKVYDAVTKSTPSPTPASSIPPISQTPWRHSTSDITNSMEHRKYIDGVLKEESGPIYVGVPGFFEAFFF